MRSWKHRVVAFLAGVMIAPAIVFAGLESGVYISDLVATNPLGSDLASTLDDHIRLLKSTIKTTFPNINGAVTVTDEQLNAVASNVAANPTATIGLTSLNGSASTYLRSDAAPALSQSIAPTWSATHTFTKTATNSDTGALFISSTLPRIGFFQSDASSNNGRWTLTAFGEQFSLATEDDAHTTSRSAIAIDRTGTTVDSIALAATSVTVNGASVRSATDLFNTGTLPAARLPGSFNGFANPSASIGLSAVNGSAATAMRSDGAPALDQSIAPTMTQTWNFTKSFGSDSPAIRLNSTIPGITWRQSNAASNNKNWLMNLSAERFEFQIRDDADSVNNYVMTVDRTGTTVDTVAFPADNANKNFVVGTAATSGAMALVRTSVNQRSLDVKGVTSAQYVLGVHNEAVNGGNLIAFETDPGSSLRGSITYTSGTGLVNYNTTSADDLKRNIKPSKSARKVIDCVKVVSHDWNVGPGHMDYWLTAGTLNPCAPWAVSYETTPEHDGRVDVSKLVPAMIKYMQEQDARIARLEANAARRH